MKRTRSKTISNRVITKANLELIWALLMRNARADDAALRSDAKLQNINFNMELPTVTVSSAGSLNTEADSDAIFDNDVIDLQKSLSINLRYANYKSGKSVSAGFREGDEGLILNSSFSVSGNDPAWVDATFADMDRIVDSIRPQSTAFKRFRPLITTLLAFSIGWSTQLIWGLLLPDSVYSGPPPSWVIFLRHHLAFAYAIEVVITYVGGIIPAMFVSSWVARLWPSIEFDFGPEHLKQTKRVRARLSTVAALLLLPFALEVFQRFALGWK